MPPQTLAKKLCELMYENQSWRGVGHIDSTDLTNVVIDGHFDMVAVAAALIAERGNAEQ
jgi:hypothetical protein